MFMHETETYDFELALVAFHSGKFDIWIAHPEIAPIDPLKSADQIKDADGHLFVIMAKV